MLAEVKTIYETNLRDVPGKLRENAAEIESGRYGNVSGAVLVLLGDAEAGIGIEVFGIGDLDLWQTLGLLEAAKQKLAQMATE